jgi:hypothetical protein
MSIVTESYDHRLDTLPTRAPIRPRNGRRFRKDAATR